MKTTPLRTSFIALLLTAVAVALSACGGGNGGSPVGMTNDGTGDRTSNGRLEPAAGLTASESAPIHATGVGSTIAELFPKPENTFAPLSSAIKRTLGDTPQAELSDEFHVRAISSDGANGFRVTYVVGGEERTVLLEESDFGMTASREYFKQSEDERFWLWSYTDSFGGAERNRGSSQFRYFDAHGLSHWTVEEEVSRRFVFVFGARTRAADLPSTAAAVYNGRAYADSYSTTDPSNGRRQRLNGNLRLVANFDLSTLTGRISGISGTDPGETDGRGWPGNRFEITDGRIVNGQFTATLTGVDADPDAPLDRSLRGFVGDVLGEFYGPAAQEVGGVLNAVRDVEGGENDRVLSGFIGGRKTANPDDDMPLSVGVDTTGYSSSSPSIASQDDGNRVTRIVGDGDGGFRVTYTIDGAAQPEVHLTAADLGQDARFPITFHRRVGATRYYLFSKSGRTPDYDHFDVKGWFRFVFPTVVSAEGGDFGDPDSGIFAFVVHGDRTADMPAAGEARYAGRAQAFAWNPNPGEGRAVRASQDWYGGDLSLTADFDASTITGEIGNLRHRAPASPPANSIAGSFAIRNGRIDGNGLTGDLSGLGFTGSGGVEGAFYGPGAAEVGGVMRATHSDGRLLQGYFGGEKQ